MKTILDVKSYLGIKQYGNRKSQIHMPNSGFSPYYGLIY